MKTIHKAGLITIENGRVLLCRKRNGSQLLILPGGKIEPGETAEQALHREIEEELGEARAMGLEVLGGYKDRAAGDDQREIVIELFKGELAGSPRACAEIAELVWFGREDDPERLAPSLRRTILPDLAKRGVLDWPKWTEPGE